MHNKDIITIMKPFNDRVDTLHKEFLYLISRKNSLNPNCSRYESKKKQIFDKIKQIKGDYEVAIHARNIKDRELARI